ncbi:class I SAM-dependent methyltransferase [Salinarimonas sp.]|uniref:class I SAM-dependent methyltransferase n=1 Tax=Salinarimonas sp. TaxID=2766526 RepID=UPI00391B25B1
MDRPLTPADAPAFIRANTRALPVPHAPEIVLHVADEATALWERTEEELGAIGLPPPFWAFAWAGGQALARYLLDTPETVRGARVLDFASGSGLVAIAAAMAGAARVEAAEIDPFALAAIALNAQANGVAVAPRAGDLVGADEGWDVVLAGDVCYERDMAARVVEWLVRLEARGALVLIGDPGRSYLPKDRLHPLATYEVPVTRALEDAEIKRASVWALRAGAAREA